MDLFTVKNLTKKFSVDKKTITVLSNLNFTLPRIGLVSIVGKSGSGKTTLLNILSGIEKPSSGSVKFENNEVKRMNDKRLGFYHLYETSMVFQHYNLFDDLCGLENVVLPLLMKGINKSEAKKKAKELFRKFNIEYLEKQKCCFMSGGEKQRIAILRALVIKPKVIFCDEPTGALDHKNSIEIMNILKEISTEILVLMVSHNNELVDRYSNQIITLKDGKIISQIGNCDEKGFLLKKDNHKYSEKWVSLFKNLNLKRNFKKNVFSIITCSISFSAILISIGFTTGSKISQKEAPKNNLEIQYGTVSKSEYIEIENCPVTYEKNIRPTADLIDETIEDESLTYELNFSYFFSHYPSGKYNGRELTDFELVPFSCVDSIKQFDSSMVSGSIGIDTIEEVIVNTEFVNLLGLDKYSVINRRIEVSNTTPVKYATNDQNAPFIEDVFSYHYQLRITGVIKEFSFLNSPKIYYSYAALKEIMQTTKMDNVSSYLKRNVSYYDFIENSSNDSPQSSYSYVVFENDYSNIENYFALIEKLDKNNEGIKITNRVYEISNSYNEFIGSFADYLILFIAISFIGINCILGMVSLSSYLLRKKESAILTCIGGRSSTIRSLFLNENQGVVIISLFVSIGLSIALETIINDYLFNRFSLPNLIAIPFESFAGIPYGLIFFLAVLSTVCNIVFTITPMLIYRKISITEELRDE